jgi:ribosomal protein L11 methyltransferase
MDTSPPTAPPAAGHVLGLVETTAPAAVFDWLEEWFVARGAQAVSRTGATRREDEARDTPPAWPVAQIRALFPAPASAETAAATLRALGFSAHASAAAIEALLAPARERLPPRIFADRLVVLGRDDPLLVPAPTAVVRLDPGAGFGTGTHPTTALCLDWLARQNLRDLLVLDYGTGSGILALAALALGARRAWGIDTDPLARASARANGRANGVGRRFLVRATSSRPPFVADLVCANLLRNILLRLAPRFPRLHRRGGYLLLSGVLASQAPEIIDAYRDLYTCEDRIEREGWAALVFRHTPHVP